MYTLEQLVIAVEEELERIGYPQPYLRRHRKAIDRFIKYAKEQGAAVFNETLGEKYLSEQFEYPQKYIQGRTPSEVQISVRSVRILGDYQQFGIVKRSSRRKARSYPDEFFEVVHTYELNEQSKNLSAATIINKTDAIGIFLFHMVHSDIHDFSKLTSQCIHNYINSFCGYSNAYIRHTARTLQHFLSFVYSSHITDTDFSVHVPTLKRVDEKHLPPIWKKDEVDRLLAAVDRGNAAGKRDYAVLLLIIRLGLRKSDVENLKLENIHWGTAKIELKQCKTGSALTLPLLNDVGEAIIDYLQYGRPDNGCPYVFLKLTPPYNQNISLGNLMNKYITATRLDVGGRAHGLHSLRHTLASRLLEEKVPITTISAVLGHANLHSTEDYLHIDIEELRKCALSIMEDLHYEQ